MVNNIDLGRKDISNKLITLGSVNSVVQYKKLMSEKNQ